MQQNIYGANPRPYNVLMSLFLEVEEVPESGGDEFAQFVKVFSFPVSLLINSPHSPRLLSTPQMSSLYLAATPT